MALETLVMAVLVVALFVMLAIASIPILLLVAIAGAPVFLGLLLAAATFTVVFVFANIVIGIGALGLHQYEKVRDRPMAGSR